MDQELRERLDRLEAGLRDLIILDTINLLVTVSTMSLTGGPAEKTEFVRKIGSSVMAILTEYSPEFENRHGIVIQKFEKGIKENIVRIIMGGTRPAP